MIDHLLKFETEAAAIAALPQHRAGDGWNGAYVVAGQRLTVSDAVLDETDPDNTVLIAPAVMLPGYYLTISLPEVSAVIRSLPNEACRVIAHRETGAILHAAADLDPSLLATAAISPVPAGATYAARS